MQLTGNCVDKNVGGYFRYGGERRKNRKEVWNEYIKTYIPLARGAQTHEDIGYMMVFLCSKYADHITGQIIYVDGGATTA